MLVKRLRTLQKSGHLQLGIDPAFEEAASVRRTHGILEGVTGRRPGWSGIPGQANTTPRFKQALPDEDVAI
jgi:hypothetical protein